MRVIYTSKGMLEKFGVRVIYGKIQYNFKNFKNIIKKEYESINKRFKANQMSLDARFKA